MYEYNRLCYFNCSKRTKAIYNNKCELYIIFGGYATIKSNIAVTILKTVATTKTLLSKSKNLPNKARRIKLIVSGYKNISTGIA